MMELDLISPVKPSNKLIVASSSPTVAIQVDIPSEIDAGKYITYLMSRIASDFETINTSIKAVEQATISSKHEDATSFGVEMSERIAKIETSLEHLSATMKAMDAKLDKLIAVAGDEKKVNAVMLDKFSEYDKKLDKKPSKDEVGKLIAEATNKQILWTIATIIAVALIVYKLLT
ncbi:hypothetical protein [Enterobacter hormaechei]|uniref:hypothetical protein n=1 Tax=Enterobacter hormaechei TaxID=158836 RepID=UPI003D6E24D0